MARIKFVLQERRLGLMAAAAPVIHKDRPRAPAWVDPMNTQGALSGTTNFTDVRIPRLLRRSPEAAATESGDVHANAATRSKAKSSVVKGESVANEEVESRDEGFGGGKEAEAFDKDVTVDEDGHVRKQ